MVQDPKGLNYNKVKAQYSAQIKKYTELQQQKRQHNLVLNSIKQMKQPKRMWKMMGGILVQKPKDEIVKILQQTLLLIGQAQVGLTQSISDSQKKIMEYQLKNGIRTQHNMLKK